MNALGPSPRRIIRLLDLSARPGIGAAPRLRDRDARWNEAVSSAEQHPSVAQEAGQGRRGGIGQAESGIDVLRIEWAVREILLAIGEDPKRDGLRDTPRRVARAYRELFAGLRQDPAVHLGRVIEQEAEDLVAVRDVEFFSVCEHHLLPFFGRAHIAYRPSGNRVVGLSKLARTVEVFARRPQAQERLTGQIADAVVAHLGAAGVAVVCEAQHTCMAMRGVSKAGSTITTAAFRGAFKDDLVEREHALRLLGLSPGGRSG